MALAKELSCAAALPSVVTLYTGLSYLSSNSGALPGAQVLGIAFAMSECHQKLLTVLLPSVDIGQDDLQ
jgi:hypothetical protein